MADILDYLDWRGDISFDISKPNEVDNLIFSALSYIDFSAYTSENHTNPISFKALLPLIKKENKNHELHLGIFINKKTIDLLIKAAQTKRFQNCLIHSHVQIHDKESETQFSATIFTYRKNKHCIAYRGTDDSILGWKEDFNMSFMEIIPSQIEALCFFKNACTNLRGSFTLVGHSKGGNLAIFAGAHCTNKEEKRIEAIYSNDAPGFHKSINESQVFDKIKNKTFSFIPEFSIIGLLLSHSIESQIVASNQTGIMSHDPFSWKVCGTSFIPSQRLDNKTVIIDTTLKTWLSELDTKKREQFVDTFFEAFLATNANTLTELSTNWLKHSATILKTLHLADSKTKEMIMKELHNLFRSYLDVRFNKK